MLLTCKHYVSVDEGKHILQYGEMGAKYISTVVS